MTDQVREALDQAWQGVAGELAEGWSVTRADSVGESTGSLKGPGSYADGLLRLRVKWTHRDAEEVLVEPAARRNLFRIESAIVISSTDALLALEPADRGS